MITKLTIQVAISLLMARWKQTLIAAIGVTFSITMFITLLSFMGGLNNLLDGLVVNRTPHIRIYNEVKPNAAQPIKLLWPNDHHFIRSVKTAGSRQEIYNSSLIMQSLTADDRVEGVSPRINAQVFFNNGTTDITGSISGIEVANEVRLFHFNEYITQGNGNDIGKIPNSIVLGKGMAEKLLAGIGDVVQITTAKGNRFQLKVVGYFQSGIKDIDKVQCYASVNTVQKLLGKPANYITDIQVRLKDIKQAPGLAKVYQQRYDADAEDIQTANAQFETGSSIRTLISYAVGITLLIVAGFGIYNILNMMIYEKMDTIAILKATGFAGKDVKQIFLLIALSIGIAGGCVGLLLGFGLSVFISHIPFNTASLPTVKTYPVYFNPTFYIIGIVFSLVTTYLAGWLPARKASRVDPVVIIRGK